MHNKHQVFTIIPLFFLLMNLINDVPAVSAKTNPITESRALLSQTKLLAQPLGLGGPNARFGQHVSLLNNRALISASNVDDGGVVYVFDFDGVDWIESEILKGDDIGAGDVFGLSVSLSADKAMVGAIGNTGSGMAYVFDFDGSRWNQTQKISASDAMVDDGFGQAVILDGNRALVAAANNNDAGPMSGSVYVFDFDGLSWNESHKIMANDAQEGARFGASLSLSGDRLLVGAAEDFLPSNGSAYVFDFNGVNWNQTQKLTANDGALADWFGFAVSLDSDRLIIGAINDDLDLINSQNEGSAYVFDYDGMAWAQTQKLTASDVGTSDKFGGSLSLSGNTIVVGAYQDDAGALESGSAYVFQNNGNNWTQTAKLISDVDSYSHFAHSVGMSNNRILVGADGNGHLGNASGSAFVYEFDGSSWNEVHTLNAIDSLENDYFGNAVSLFESRALVGAYGASNSVFNSGSAYLFEFDGIAWTFTNKLRAPDETSSDSFGVSVSMFGNRAVVGSNNDRGAVYVFEFDGLNWNPTDKLIPPQGVTFSGFGNAVSLGNDRVLIGAYLDEQSILDAGAAYVYDFEDSEWNLSQVLTADDADVEDYFGYAVSLFEDRALIGAYRNDDAGTNSGAAYVFDLTGKSWVQSTKLIPTDDAFRDYFGFSVSLDFDRLLIGAFQDDDLGHNSGSAFIYDYSGLDWQLTQKLLAHDGNALDNFGYAVSLEGDRVTIGARSEDGQDINSGSAYVFDFADGSWIQTQKLVAADGESADALGASVSLSNGLSLVGASFDDDNGSNSGSVYIFSSDDLIFDNGFE